MLTGKLKRFGHVIFPEPTFCQNGDECGDSYGSHIWSALIGRFSLESSMQLANVPW